MNYNEYLKSKEIPEKLLKDLSLDNVLEKQAALRKKLIDKIHALKIIGINYGDMAEIIGRSKPAISQLITAGHNRYDWSYNRLADALEKLEAHND